MYTGDKNQRITLRLNPAQFAFIQHNAEIMGVSPSDFLRMMINSVMTMHDAINEGVEQEREENRRENEIAHQHDQL